MSHRMNFLSPERVHFGPDLGHGTIGLLSHTIGSKKKKMFEIDCGIFRENEGFGLLKFTFRHVYILMRITWNANSIA